MLVVRRSFRTLCALVSVSAISAFGCGGESDTSASTAGEAGGAGSSSSTSSRASSSSTGGGAGGGHPMDAKAHLRVVHGSPDAPAVDVYQAGGKTPLLKGLTYGDTSAYLELAPGTYRLELRASPSTASDPVAYATDAMVMHDGEKLTAVAAGLLGSTNDGDKFRVLALEEGFGAAGSGNAIVRVVHIGADAPSVGIDIDNDDPSSPEITGLDRFTDSGSAGFPLTAGRADKIGIVANGARVTAFTTPQLPEGAELFVFATGLTAKLGREADGFSLLAVGPDGTVGFVKQDPIVYALHASPDAPEVDAFVGAAKVVDGISFGSLATAVQVPPGSYQLDFFAHDDAPARPSTSPAASGSTGALAAGERYLAVATGFLSSSDPTQSFRVAAYAEGFALDDAANTRLRIVHASPDAPPVDIGVLNVEHVVSPVLVPGIVFGSASDGAGVSASPGTLPIGVAPAGDDATIVAAIHVPVVAGGRAFALAAGALDASRGQSFRLLAVDTTASPWTVATVMPQP